MPALRDFSPLQKIKAVLLGDPGTRKTSSLVALLKYGYQIRMLDFDNRLLPLANNAHYYFPEAFEDPMSFRFVSCRDKYVFDSNGIQIQGGRPQALNRATKMLGRWTEELDEGQEVDGKDFVDLGPPADWSSNEILVIDSLSLMGWATLLQSMGMNNRLGGKPTWPDYQWAQALLEQILITYSADNIGCSFVVISHLNYQEDESRLPLIVTDGNNSEKIKEKITYRKGYCSSVGRKLDPKIPRTFDYILHYKTDKNGNSIITTRSDGIVDCKVPDHVATPAEVSLEGDSIMEALNEIFRHTYARGGAK